MFYNYGDTTDQEKIEQYKSFGFNIVGSQPYLMTGNNDRSYYVRQMTGFLDNCAAGGLKGIVYDNRLGSLVGYCDSNVDNKEYYYSINSEKTELVGSGENALFATQAEFESYVADLVSDYKDHAAFGGIHIYDEPNAAQFDRYAAVVKAIKKVIPDVYIHALLLPIYANNTSLTGDTSLSKQEAFRDYLTNWVDKVGLDYIQFDSYPFFTDDPGIQNEHINGIKIAAEVCKAKNVDLMVYVQTFARYKDGKYYERQVAERDTYWQINMLLGYGADGVGYYMYSDKGNGYNIKGSTLVDSDGNITELGESVKKINAEIKEFTKILSFFDYVGSASYGTKLDHVTITNDALSKLTASNVSGTALITELKDEARGNYMYMIQNVSDSTEGKGSALTMNATFGGYKKVTVYVNGVATEYSLTDGTLAVDIENAGDAIFVLLQR